MLTAMQFPDRVPNGLTVLDAFCCAGGAGMGYWLAGFDVVGVDVEPQSNYPFEFHQGDAVAYIAERGAGFDLVHASPPCQFDCTLTAGTNRDRRDGYADLLDPTRDALEVAGRPYVIEQPPGGTRRGHPARLHPVARGESGRSVGRVTACLMRVPLE